MISKGRNLLLNGQDRESNTIESQHFTCQFLNQTLQSLKHLHKDPESHLFSKQRFSNSPLNRKKMFAPPEKDHGKTFGEGPQYGGESVGPSMAPPKFDPQASTPGGEMHKMGKGPIQKKDPEDAIQGENEFAESPFSRLAMEQQFAIELFASKTHSRVKGWGELRKMHTSLGSGLSYKEYNQQLFDLAGGLYQGWKDFVQFFFNIDRKVQQFSEEYGIMMPETLNDHPLNFEDAKKELGRHLNVGLTPEYIKEIVQMHAYQLDSSHSIRAYAELFGLKYKSVDHEYSLSHRLEIDATKFKPKSEEGMPKLEPGGGGPKGKTTATVNIMEIEYSNILGHSWKVISVGGTIGKSVGGSLNHSSGVGIDKKVGDATEKICYTPAYFESQHAVITQGSLEGTDGKEVRGVFSIGNVGFDMKKEGDGKSVLPGIGAGVSFGHFYGSDPMEQEGFEEELEAKKKAVGTYNIVPVMNSSVHFGTESFELESNDYETIHDLADSIIAHEHNFPGDPFLIKVTGYASQRWEQPDKSANKYGVEGDAHYSPKEKLNTGLALNRANAVKDELGGKLWANFAEFKQGTLDECKIVTDAQVLKDEIFTENDPRARAATITVFYSDSPRQNIGYNDTDKAVYNALNANKF